MKKQHIVVLYDKEDVLEFNKNNNKNFKNVFVFSPGLELFLNDKENLKICKPDMSSNSILQKKILLHPSLPERRSLDLVKMYYEQNHDYFLDNIGLYHQLLYNK